MKWFVPSAVFGITCTVSVGAIYSLNNNASDLVPMATGVVFEDLDRDGIRDPGEPGIRGVRVSNQREIVLTDAQGRWVLPVSDDTTIFVTKPRNYMTPVNEQHLPQFHYVHKPMGSPSARFGGVAPTGGLPASINFPLYRRPEKDEFSALFFGDTQSRDVRELGYLTESLLSKIDPEGSQFGVTLGDILFDDLSLFEQHNQAIALIGIPWYNVLGNHDINFDAKTDELSDETFQKFYGPNYYSYEHGKAVFLVLDNVDWRHSSTQEDGKSKYVGSLGTQQMDWIKNELKYIPRDRLLVLMMHIPLLETAEKDQILDLLKDRPFTLSASAHTHTVEHHFLKNGDHEHHHYICVTTCGSWWGGEPDEYGIPHSTMRDGAPRGYSVVRFKGNQYEIEYRATGRPKHYQMNIQAPESVSTLSLSSTDVFVNVFNGSERSLVEMRFAGGEWVKLKQVKQPDPSYATMHARNENIKTPFRGLPAPEDSTHLWAGKLTKTWRKGVLPIEVRTKDMHGNIHTQIKGIKVE